MDLSLHSYSPHIRPIRTRQDLNAVADLVELCFADTMDADGREYLRHMRRVARDSFGMGVNGLERLTLPIQGFVWEENERIIGNLTLISFMRYGRRYYLIANVAVHPDHRRKGIARRLTMTGLDFARNQGVDAAWLQVRNDNPGAFELYRSLGFVEQARRTLWMWEPSTFVRTTLPVGVHVGRRTNQDWQKQSAWLDEVYPDNISWNLPYSKERLKPGLLNSLVKFLNGERLLQLSARLGEHLVGVVSWEPSHMHADNLWLAVPRDRDDIAIRVLLPKLRVMLNAFRPLMVNFPTGRGVEAFQAVGFQPHNTLIWMNVRFR